MTVKVNGTSALTSSSPAATATSLHRPPLAIDQVIRTWDSASSIATST